MPCAAHRQQEWEDAQLPLDITKPYVPVPTSVMEKRRYRLSNLAPEVWAFVDRGRLPDPVLVQMPSGKQVWIPKFLFEMLYEKIY